MVLSVGLIALTGLAGVTPARAAQVGGVGVASPGRAPAQVVIVPRATIPAAATAVGTPVPGAAVPAVGTPVPGAAAPAVGTPVPTVAAGATPGAVTPTAGTPASPTFPQSSVSPSGDVDVSQQELYYLYLSQLYGAQAPPSPAAEAAAAKNATDYFTNGAALTSVPTSGPTARYFTDGSQVATIPTTVIPSYSFAPIYPRQSQAVAVDAGEPPPPPPIPEAGSPVEEPAEDAGAAPVNTSPSAPSGPSPAGPSETPPTNGELTSMYESLLALYPTPTVPAPGPSAPVAESTPSTAATEEPTEATPARPGPLAGPLARREARHSSTAAIVGALVGGIALGAILMFLGARMNPRPRTHA